jgi:hypothetical protein
MGGNELEEEKGSRMHNLCRTLAAGLRIAKSDDTEIRVGRRVDHRDGVRDHHSHEITVDVAAARNFHEHMNLSPLYKGQVLVHGLGFSPDRRRSPRHAPLPRLRCRPE